MILTLRTDWCKTEAMRLTNLLLWIAVNHHCNSVAEADDQLKLARAWRLPYSLAEITAHSQQPRHGVAIDLSSPPELQMVDPQLFDFCSSCRWHAAERSYTSTR